MIYQCRECGAYFSTATLNDAIKKNLSVIECKYCQTANEFRERGTDLIARGYYHLSEADFYQASESFSQAISEAFRHGSEPSYSAYIGNALAQFNVQVIFDSEEEFENERPQLVCYGINKEMYFSEQTDVRLALEKLADAPHEAGAIAAETAKIHWYSETLDAIYKHYKEIERSKPNGFSYGAFVAYEDITDGEENHGHEVGRRVANKLDGVKNVFFPDRDEFEYGEAGDRAYEAAILYAIDHSKCMLVIMDNDINQRLRGIFRRFYEREKYLDKNLCFVRFRDRIMPRLPGVGGNANYVFDLEEELAYVQFAQERAGSFVDIGGGPGGPEGPGGIDGPGRKSTDPYAPEVGEGQYVLGTYPQRRAQKVEPIFDQFPKPSATEQNGWTVLFVNQKGVPYTWYRDEVIEGKKYRGIYFTQYREVYSVQKSNLRPELQRKNDYTLKQVFCFEFNPVYWDVREVSSSSAVLVAHQGLAPMEYNDCEMDMEWETASLRRWLNEDFFDTAFTDEEKERLRNRLNSEDKVFLIDKKDKKCYANRRDTVAGTDYYRCIGGTGYGSVDGYWITDLYMNENDCYLDEDEAPVLCVGKVHSIAGAYIDRTAIAVVPKIILNADKA